VVVSLDEVAIFVDINGTGTRAEEFGGFVVVLADDNKVGNSVDATGGCVTLTPAGLLL
jgi:hypothetical protein